MMILMLTGSGSAQTVAVSLVTTRVTRPNLDARVSGHAGDLLGCRAPPDTSPAVAPAETPSKLSTHRRAAVVRTRQACVWSADRAVDVDEVTIMQAAAEYVQTHVGSLNLLLNVTGVLHSAEGLAPERALAKVEAANLLQSYHVNAVGPTMVTRAFAPLLQTTAASTHNRCATRARVGGHVQGKSCDSSNNRGRIAVHTPPPCRYLGGSSLDACRQGGMICV